MTQHRPEADFFDSDLVSSDTDQPAGRRFKAVPADTPVERGRHFKNDAPDFGPSYQPRHGGSDQRVLPPAPTASRPAPPTPRLVKIKRSPLASPHLAALAPARVPAPKSAPRFPVRPVPVDTRWTVLPAPAPKRATINTRRHLPAPLTLADFLPALVETSSESFEGIERELPSLRKALQEKALSAETSDSWWKELVGDAFSERQLAWRMSPRLLAAASVAAIVAIGATHLPTPSSNVDQLAAAAAETTIAPNRDDAMQAASRSFIRASVATPSTAAPTTVPPTTTPPTTAAPVKTTPPTTAVRRAPAAPVVPSSYAKCSSSKAAAHECWDGLINQYDWNDTTAFNVMWCESTGNPNARNPRSTATGLFQILGGTTDPTANVRQAHTMWKARGWQPWVCKG